jgi:hypothetical protein
MITDTTSADCQDVYPLTPMQSGILFHVLRAQDANPYVEQFVLSTDGQLDTGRLAAAWQEVIRRHPMLRTAFVWEGVERPVQVVVGECRLPLSEEDLRGRTEEQVATALAEFLTADRARGVPITEIPLMRLALLRHTRGCVLVWTLHHLVMDGWSMPIVLGEMATLYRTAGTAALPTPRPFRDFLTWLGTRETAAAEAFWRERLAGVRPTVRGNHSANGNRPGRADRALGSSLTTAVTRFAQRSKVTLNTVFLGAWALLLAGRTGSHDVLFGITVSGRPADLPGAEDIVGVLINTVPARVPIRGDVSVRTFLRDIQRAQLDSAPHQHLGLADIQRCAGIPAGEPMFDSILAFENYPGDGPVFDMGDGIQLAIREIREDTGYPLTLAIIPRPSDTELQLFHDAGAHTAAGGLLDELTHVLAAMVSHADGVVDSVLSPAARPADTVTNDQAPAEKRDEHSGAELFDRPAARLMRSLWQDILGHPALRAGSDFFRSGGDSLAAVRLVGQLRTVFGPGLVVNDVFAHPTLEGLLHHVDDLVGGAGAADRAAAGETP